jgi:hypothetical protein
MFATTFSFTINHLEKRKERHSADPESILDFGMGINESYWMDIRLDNRHAKCPVRCLLVFWGQ